MAPIAIVFAAATGATALVALAVACGWTTRVDARLLAALRYRPQPRADGKPTRITTAMRDLTALGGDTLRLLFVAACLFGLVADHRAPAGLALVAIFASARALLFVLKRMVRRARPEPDAHALVTYTSSFPSGHTFLAVVVYLSAALLIPAGAPAAVLVTGLVLALALGAAIGATRVAFGIHWPSDVVAGWCAAIAWVSGCILIVGGRV